MGYRWKPNAAQRAAYSARMRAIENTSSEKPTGYDIDTTGDVVKGDDIAFFNAGKTSERLYGTVVSESYGSDKGQHTFTIEVSGEFNKILIKGRNLYKNKVFRKSWKDELERQNVLDEKHKRGTQARAARESNKMMDQFDRTGNPTYLDKLTTNYLTKYNTNEPDNSTNS